MPHAARSRAGLSLLLLLVALGGGDLTPARGADGRPLTPDDLFRIEEVGEVAISPDGSDAAVVIRAPVSPGRGHGRMLLLGGDRSDVWLVPLRGVGSPRPITAGGKTDGSGWWRPLWSPDGRTLALLSTQGGDNVRLFAWDRASGETRRLTEDGVDLWAAVEPVTKAPFAWLDDGHLLVALVAPGRAHVSFTLDHPGHRDAAIAGWNRAKLGAETSASVIDAGPNRPAEPPARGRLARVDLATGSVRTVCDGNIIEAQAAPDGKHVAVVAEAGRYRPREGTPLPAFTDRGPSSLAVARLDDSAEAPAARWVDGVEPRTKIRRVHLAWTGDGAWFAIPGRPADSPSDAATDTLYLVGTDGSRRAIGGPGFRANSTARVGPALLALGRREGTTRDEWWIVDPSDPSPGPALAPAAITAAIPGAAVPESWLALGDHQAVALTGGKVWQLDPTATGLARCFNRPMPDGRLAQSVRAAGGGTSPAVVVECRPRDPKATAGDLVVLSGAPETAPVILDRPRAPEARLIEAGANGAGVYTNVSPEATTVWATGGVGSDRAETRPFHLNTFLADVADAQFRSIGYRGSDGNSLTAHVLLPPGHKDGEKHPTVVWVYPGSVVTGDRREELLQKNSRHPINLVLLAARGYAVLVPSLPLSAEGRTADPLVEFSKGVLPAVDRMVELGLADPEKLAIFGHSYGGYCVYGLLTQTRRFKAGIAMAGITDLQAIHGSFDARVRHEPDPFYNLFGPKWSEIGQGRMGASPWTDPDRFRRNSPITYVDRVQTPLLMVHGDLDFVPIQQAEAFYTGLLRLGRRARFVRFWGEGHMPESPANVREMWSQIFRWLDEHLGSATESPGKKG